jgi:NAD(P)-dependent dehydrogenase (short-subunit alcohol dehydrogenase family)
MGRATAVALAANGMDIAITWHTDEAGAEVTAEEVRARGSRAVTAGLDTADITGVGGEVDRLNDDLGAVDVFVKNAGTGDNAPFLELTLDQWRDTVAVDLDGAFVCLQRDAQHMVRTARGGRLIAVTSVHERQPRVGSAGYDAAKHGLGGLMKTLALTGNEGVDSHSIPRPGVPLGRPGDAREVAAVIAFLASPAASYVTSASLVDGGMLQMGPQAGSHIESDAWRRY